MGVILGLFNTNAKQEERQMAKFIVTDRIIKRLPKGVDIQGEIELKELKMSHKKRMKQILKEDDEYLVTCMILRDEYRYSSEITDKKAKGYILTDDNRYLKIVASRLLALLPFGLAVFIINNVFFMKCLTVVTEGAVGIAAIICLYNFTPLENIDIGNPFAWPKPKVETTIANNEEESSKVENTTENTTENITDYTGDEIESILNPEEKPSEDEDKYTVIDGIAYQGDYLTLNRGVAIPLGNNPENAKTNIELEFLVYVQDKLIFKSIKLKPGQGVNFIPSEYLENGLHNLHIVVNAYHPNGQQDLGGDLEIRINLVD